MFKPEHYSVFKALYRNAIPSLNYNSYLKHIVCSQVIKSKRIYLDPTQRNCLLVLNYTVCPWMM